ncbi:MAG: rhomboid family GlyGly-CTERM serine protease [Candidatus Paceibacteria bacterium]
MSHASRSLLWRAYSVAILVFGAWVASEHRPELQLERSAVGHGEWWRLWTGHLVHGSVEHFRYDVAVAALMGLAFGRLWWLLMAAPALSLALLFGLPGLEYYFGLSGLLHAWMVLEAGKLAREQRGWPAALAGTLALGTLLKAGLETALEQSFFSADMQMGGAVVHASHFIGSLFGLFLLLAGPLTSRWLSSVYSSCARPR